MKGIATMTLIILVALVVIGLSLALIGNVYGSWKYNSTAEIGNEIISKTGDVNYVKPISEDLIKVTPLDHIITSSGENYQPSEVACQIADVIYNDFKKNGDSIDRSSGDNVCWKRGLTNTPIECLLYGADVNNLKLFTLAIGDPGPNSGTDWENTLFARQCNLCREPVSAGGTAIPLLDETCVNMQFKDRQVGNTPFCNGEFSPENTISGQQVPLVTFGNKDCYTPDYNKNPPTGISSWASHCTDSSTNTNNFCYSQGKDLIYNWDNWWVADCTGDSNGKNYCPDVGSDSSETVKDLYKSDTHHGTLDHDGRPYIFGVTWINENKKYDVLFSRVPEKKLINPGDLLNQIFNLEKKDNEIFRYGKLGYFTSYARRTADLVLMGDGTTAVSQIMAKIGDAAGFKSYDETCKIADSNQIEGTKDSEGCVFFSACNNEADCINTILMQLSKKDIEYINDEIVNDFNKKSIVVKSNIQNGPNGVLDSSKRYRIVVNNWFDYNEANSYGENSYEFMWYTRTVGIQELNKKNCCGSPESDSQLTLTFGSQNVQPGQPIQATAGSLYYCNGKTVQFYTTNCDGKHVDDPSLTKVAECTIINPEEDTYCQTEEAHNPTTTSCTATFNAPNDEGPHTYYACIDKDGDGVYDASKVYDATQKEVASAILTVSSTASSLSCILISGGCNLPHSSSSAYVSTDNNGITSRCRADKDIAAVQCPIINGVQYHILSGGCRAKSKDSRLSHSCPTNDPDSGLLNEVNSCNDYQTGPPYSWWLCNYKNAADYVTPYATCCNI